MRPTTGPVIVFHSAVDKQAKSVMVLLRINLFLGMSFGCAKKRKYKNKSNHCYTKLSNISNEREKWSRKTASLDLSQRFKPNLQTVPFVKESITRDNVVPKPNIITNTVVFGEYTAP